MHEGLTRTTGDTQPSRGIPKKNQKKRRNWDEGLSDSDSATQLDFSELSVQASTELEGQVMSPHLSRKDLQGNDLPIPQSISNIKTKDESLLSRLLSSALGTRKISSADALEASQNVKTELLRKNVSENVAEHICQTLQSRLPGLGNERSELFKVI